jgi:hypothetical protein
VTELAIGIGLVIAAVALFAVSIRLGMLVGLRLDRVIESHALADLDPDPGANGSEPSAALSEPERVEQVEHGELARNGELAEPGGRKNRANVAYREGPKGREEQRGE